MRVQERNGAPYEALSLLCDVQLACASGDSETWGRALRKAARIGDGGLYLAVSLRGTNALSEADRVCRRLNPGYAAAAESAARRAACRTGGK